MADKTHKTGREADDIRIGWSFRIILMICAVAFLAALIIWITTEDAMTASCTRVATCIFAGLFVLMLFAARGEVETNKMLRDARIGRGEEKTN